MLSLLREEAHRPGTVDKVLLVQQLHEQLRAGAQLPAELLTWYTGTLDRWRRSLRAVRPLADVHPADRPRVRALLMNNEK